MTPAQRSLWGRIGAAVARSRHDPRELTAAGRAKFLSTFEARVRADFPDLNDAEVMRRAGELRKAHFLRLAAKSAAARSKKKGTPATNGSALEVNGVPTTATTTS